MEQEQEGEEAEGVRAHLNLLDLLLLSDDRLVELLLERLDLGVAQVMVVPGDAVLLGEVAHERLALLEHVLVALLEGEEPAVRRLRLRALALVDGERVLLVAEALLGPLALRAQLVEVGLVVLDLGLELLLRVCASRKRRESALCPLD